LSMPSSVRALGFFSRKMPSAPTPVPSPASRLAREPIQKVSKAWGMAPCYSDVEAEVHDIALLDDVLLAFQAQPAGFLRASLAFVLDEVVVGDHFGADEAALEIGVDDTRRLRRGGAYLHG